MVRHTQVRAALLALSAMSASSCVDEPRCAAVDRCDVREPSCQQAALAQAVCLRDRGESTNLTIGLEVLTREQLVAQRVAEAQAEDTPLERTRMRGLALLGLSPTASTPESEARAQARYVGASYRSNPPRITVVDEGYPLNSGYLMRTLVHEMVHALQDAAGELAGAALQYDARLAQKAITEGEATIFEDEAWAAGYELSFDSLPYAKVLSNYRVNGPMLPLLGNERNDAFSSMYARFTYPWGASYLWPLRRDGGAAALVPAHSPSPVSTYAVMAGQRDLRPNDLADQAVPLLPGLTLTVTMHLGRFVYASFRRVERTGWVLPRDESFVADTLSVFVSADGAALVFWHLRFDDSDPFALDRTINFASERGLRVRRVQNDLWITGAENATLLDTLPEAPSFQAAPAADTGFEQTSKTIACPIHAPNLKP